MHVKVVVQYGTSLTLHMSQQELCKSAQHKISLHFSVKYTMELF